MEIWDKKRKIESKEKKEIRFKSDNIIEAWN